MWIMNFINGFVTIKYYSLLYHLIKFRMRKFGPLDVINFACTAKTLTVDDIQMFCEYET